MFNRILTRVVLALSILSTSLFVFLGHPATANAAPLNPSANIPASPAYPSACSTDPAGGTCVYSAIAALNHARAVMGLGPYSISAGFASLPPEAQFFLLTNQDRAVYGLQQIKGVNANLNWAAYMGVLASTDPTGVGSILGYGFRYWASNWAAGYKSPLYTYYEWMYNDGPGGTNIDCRYNGDSGCWGHRLNALKNFGPGVQILMGGSSGGSALYGGAMSFTELFESFPAAAPIPTVPVVGGFTRLDTNNVMVSGRGFTFVKNVTVGGVAQPWTPIDTNHMYVRVPRGTSLAQVVVNASGGVSAMTIPSLLKLV